MEHTSTLNATYYVHVFPANLRENIPAYVIRPAHSPREFRVVDTVEWDGPTRTEHNPTNPLPNTDGRGVAWISTLEGCNVQVRLQENSPLIDASTLF